MYLACSNMLISCVLLFTTLSFYYSTKYKCKEDAAVADASNTSSPSTDGKHGCKATSSTNRDSVEVNGVEAKEIELQNTSEVPVSKLSSTQRQHSSDIATTNTPDTNTVSAPESVKQSNPCNNEATSSITVDEACTPFVPPLPASWKQLLSAELHVVSACLQHNPKSYGAWHHRSWVMEQLCRGESPKDRQKAWDSELGLCNLFLTKDERNCKRLFLSLHFIT